MTAENKERQSGKKMPKTSQVKVKKERRKGGGRETFSDALKN